MARPVILALQLDLRITGKYRNLQSRVFLLKLLYMWSNFLPLV